MATNSPLNGPEAIQPANNTTETDRIILITGLGGAALGAATAVLTACTVAPLIRSGANFVETANQLQTVTAGAAFLTGVDAIINSAVSIDQFRANLEIQAYKHMQVAGIDVAVMLGNLLILNQLTRLG